MNALLIFETLCFAIPSSGLEPHSGATERNRRSKRRHNEDPLAKKSSRPMWPSNLVIENVGSEHSGNYSCAPENAAAATVTVYVLRGQS